MQTIYKAKFGIYSKENLWKAIIILYIKQYNDMHINIVF